MRCASGDKPAGALSTAAVSTGAPRRRGFALRALVRGAVLSFALVTAGDGGALACPTDFPVNGMAKRTASAPFLNTKGLFGRLEAWSPTGTRLRLHAAYFDPTDEYGHGVLGDLKDGKGLTIRITANDGSGPGTCPTGVFLPEGLVFEGVTPLVADVDPGGYPEVVVTESSVTQGARLSIYDRHGERLASTPFIGQRNRWLSLIGAGDLDGDGRVEIAYIDRPHLAQVLRVWRYDKGRLTEVANAEGFTNHRIGWPFIEGGVRDCGQGPEMILASGDWSKIMAVRFDGRLQARMLAGYAPAMIGAAMECR